MKEEDIKHIIETTVETCANYPVKDLVYRVKRDYISGFVKDPTKCNPKVNDGFTGCAWYPSGRALPKLTKFGMSKKTRPDLDLKILPKKTD